MRAREEKPLRGMIRRCECPAETCRLALEERNGLRDNSGLLAKNWLRLEASSFSQRWQAQSPAGRRIDLSKGTGFATNQVYCEELAEARSQFLLSSDIMHSGTGGELLRK